VPKITVIHQVLNVSIITLLKMCLVNGSVTVGP